MPSAYAGRWRSRGRRCGECRRCTQASDETEAGGVESVIGVCRRVTIRKQEVGKVLSVSQASRSRVIRPPGIESQCHSSPGHRDLVSFLCRASRSRVIPLPGIEISCHSSPGHRGLASVVSRASKSRVAPLPSIEVSRRFSPVLSRASESDVIRLRSAMMRCRDVTLSRYCDIAML